MSRPSEWRATSSVSACDEAFEQRKFDIPYFAHQQMDPEKFRGSLSFPVAPPPGCPSHCMAAKQPLADWEEKDDDIHDFSDDDDEYSQDDTKPKHSKKSRKRPDGSSYKVMRMIGGRPAMAKRITAGELCSDDEMIVRMKNAKYLEKDIAKRLADEGRVAYNPKTIGTRWIRLKKAIQKHNDELLDAELTDWHEGDDEVLRKALEKANAETNKAMAAAEEKRWRIVADQMKAMKPVTNFSMNACKARHEALQTGSAKPCPETIPNPSEAVRASIKSRRDKERQIVQDRIRLSAEVNVNQSNIDNNAWTSRMKKFY